MSTQIQAYPEQTEGAAACAKLLFEHTTDLISLHVLSDTGTYCYASSSFQTMLGYDNTIPVTMDDMIHHTRAVVRGTRRALVIADLPFMTYHPNRDDALRNAGRISMKSGFSMRWPSSAGR